MKYINLLFFLIIINTEALAFTKQNFYCIQVSSSKRPDIVRQTRYLKGYPELRVEKIGNFYTIRIGFWKDFNTAKDYLTTIKKKFKGAFVRKCKYQPTRWIWYAKTETKSRKIGEKQSRIKKLKLLEDYNKALKQVSPPKVELPVKKKTKFERAKSTVVHKTKKSWYFFLDGYDYWGLKPIHHCRRKGREIISRLGFRLIRQIRNRLSLWADARIGVGYQKFMKSSRRKYWIDLRYLFLSSKNAFERNSGVQWSLGRMPIRENRGFWYYNYLDGLKLEYLSTTLYGMLFAGTRLEDSRVSSSEEKIKIEGYKYLIANLDYQYYYRKHLQVFFVKERRNDYSENVGEVFSTWSSTRPKQDLNWIGLSLRGTGEFNFFQNYWIDLAYMWGKKGIISDTYLDCSADHLVLDKRYRRVYGFGGEVGVKGKRGKFGWGGRFALGEGSKRKVGHKQFFLTKISNSMEKVFGENRYRYYGELANPDLNNIVILSLFGGYEVTPQNWLILNIVKYQQYKKGDYAPFSRYLINTNGESADLGWEIDLSVNGKSTDSMGGEWRYIVTGSYFIPGDAYNGVDEANRAYGVNFRIKRYW
jgi:hypothetical protein